MWLRIKLLTVLSVLYLTSISGTLADWRSDIGVFRIGIVTGDQASAFTLRAEPFRLSLQEALNMEVEFFTAKRPESIIDALSSDRIEYAIFSASSYALAWSVCECVEPIVSPKSADGTDGYNLVLLTRQDGPKNLNELPDSNIGLLSSKEALEVGILKLALEKAGLSENDVNFQTAKSGEVMLLGFLDGKIDALLGWSSLTGDPSTGYTRGTLQILARKTGELATKFPIIWKSNQLSHRVHTLRKKLPGESKQILKSTLQSMFKDDPVAYDSVEPIYGGGFATSRHSRFQPFIDAIQDLKPEVELGNGIKPSVDSQTEEKARQSEN